MLELNTGSGQVVTLHLVSEDYYLFSIGFTKLFSYPCLMKPSLSNDMDEYGWFTKAFLSLNSTLGLLSHRVLSVQPDLCQFQPETVAGWFNICFVLFFNFESVCLIK